MRTLLLAALTVALTPAWGQKLDLKFDAIAAKAQEKAEVDLDGQALALALKSFKPKGTNGLDNVVAGITGVFVRSFEFANAGEYADSDLDSLRRQLGTGSGWSRILAVKEKNESTEIYTYGGDGKPGAFLVIAAEAKELTVVHILGSIQIAQLGQLQELVQSSVRYHHKDTAN